MALVYVFPNELRIPLFNLCYTRCTNSSIAALYVYNNSNYSCYIRVESLHATLLHVTCCMLRCVACCMLHVACIVNLYSFFSSSVHGLSTGLRTCHDSGTLHASLTAGYCGFCDAIPLMQVVLGGGSYGAEHESP